MWDRIIQLVADWVDRAIPRSSRDFQELLFLIIWVGSIGWFIVLLIINLLKVHG